MERQPHILLVDDEEDLLRTMTLILDMEKYDVSAAADGRQALEILLHGDKEKGPVDILVTDVEMPGFSGLDLLDNLNRLGRRIPTLVITGYGSKRMVVDLLRKGADDYLDKPFAMEELTRRVRSLLTPQVSSNPKTESAETSEEAAPCSDLRLEMMGRLAGGVIHDINNGLAAIHYCANQLTGKLREAADNPDGPTRYNLDCLLKATASARRTIQLYQALCRKEPLAMEPVDIHEIVHEALTLVKATIGRDATILLDLSIEQHTVYGERVLLMNSLINLLLNAYDALPGSGGRILIRTEESEKEGKPFLLLTVADTGEGIAESDQAHLFEPCFTTKGHKGNGMGLAGVMDTVKHHHGAIEVDSRKGEGAVFRVFLPLFFLV